MEESTAVTVVKVFAVLNWIGSAFAILAGLGMAVLGPAMFSFMATSGDAVGTGMMGIIGGFPMVAGIVLLALGVVGIFVGLGLWRHQNWARIVTLIFAVLLLLSLFSGNFLGAIIGAIQVWLFGFDKTVIGLFKK